LWVIIVLLSLIAVLTLILSVPVELAFAAAVPGRPRARLKLLWLFGLVGREITGKEKPEKKPAPEKPKPVKKKKRRFKDIFVLLRTRGLVKQFRIFIRDLFRCFQIRDLNADIRVGLGNPDDTGMLFAVIGPSVFWLSSTFPLSVNVQPAFEDEVTFEGHARGKVRLRPIRLLIPITRLLFSITVFRLLKNFIASRWKRKKK
jgi:hypothetical protein